MLSKESVRSNLHELTQKEEVYFTKRGNAAVNSALKIIKQLGKSTVLIPDQGGWMTYEPFAKRRKLGVFKFTTEHGVFSKEHLSVALNTLQQQGTNPSSCALLCNSMPAYAFNLDIKEIATFCEEQDIFFINDVAASIAEPIIPTLGDIIIGSFGKAKPLCLEEGGFIAASKEILSSLLVDEPDINYALLQELVTTLPLRTQEVKAYVRSLKDFFKKEHISVLHAAHQGYNVIVSFSTDEEKEKLIKTAQSFDATIEYTVCPRYIRVEELALSFEVKRRFTKI